MPKTKNGSRRPGNSEEGFNEFAKRLVRPPPRRVYGGTMVELFERALSCSNHLEKMHKLSEVALSVKDKRKIPIHTVEAAFVVSACFARVELKPERDSVGIPWSFRPTKENYRKYIAPWHKIDLDYFPLETRLALKYPMRPVDSSGNIVRYTPEDLDESRTLVSEAIGKEIHKLEPVVGFFEITCCLSRESYLKLLTEFENWALSRLLAVQNHIADQLD